VLLGIEYINNNGIIHSDIKPENILIEYKNKNDIFKINSIKIIDYGSAFYYENTSSISSNTPEYLCPEITNGNKKFLKELSNDKKYINCIDIWSFGITLLELCLCCPIWMSYKSKIIINGKPFYSLGYFGCRGRDGNKIYQKQIELSKNLGKILKNSLLYLLNKSDREKFVNLLGKMLEFDYKKRITIKDAINHEFLFEKNNDIDNDHVNDNINNNDIVNDNDN
jgi:serine/threonine protein kinase